MNGLFGQPSHHPRKKIQIDMTQRHSTNLYTPFTSFSLSFPSSSFPSSITTKPQKGKIARYFCSQEYHSSHIFIYIYIPGLSLLVLFVSTTLRHFFQSLKDSKYLNSSDYFNALREIYNYEIQDIRALPHFSQIPSIHPANTLPIPESGTRG